MKKCLKVRGTRDMYGKDILLFNYILETSRKLAFLFNFKEMYIPIFEYSDIFIKSIGYTTDIVHRETYRFLDRNKNDITLRPEFTTGIMRAIISNNILKTPMRVFSQGSVFRHERPQKGRLRQFNQVNFEYLGYLNINSEIEVIHFAYSILLTLNIKDKFLLKVNTLGNSIVKIKYKLALQNYLLKYRNNLSYLDKIRLAVNPLRILDTKYFIIQRILKFCPKLYYFINKREKNNFLKLSNCLKSLNICFIHDFNLVRGIDYYSGIVFEFVSLNSTKSNTIIAGGRYNNLFYNMCGKKVKGIGFAIGVERVIDIMSNTPINTNISKSIYLIPIGKVAEKKSARILNYMRNNYIPSFIDFGISFKKRIKLANKYSITYILLYGNRELNNGRFIIKNMKTGFQKFIDINNIIKYIKYI